MKRTFLFTAVIAFGMLVQPLEAEAFYYRGKVVFTVHLTGGQQNPPVTASSLGFARAYLSNTKNGLTLHYIIKLKGVDLDGNQTPTDTTDDVWGVHFHDGDSGTNGPVVFGMIGPGHDTNVVINAAHGIIRGSWQVGDGGAALIDQVEGLFSKGLYINVHTFRNNSGELRGQVIPRGGAMYFYTKMTGGQEVPPDTVTSGKGLGLFRLGVRKDCTPRLDYWYRIWKLDLDSMQTTDSLDDVWGTHIHMAPAGSNGPVVFGIKAPYHDLDDNKVWVFPSGGFVKGSWDAGDGGAPLATRLKPLFLGNLYINVHTSGNPSGAIRGQIEGFLSYFKDDPDEYHALENMESTLDQPLDEIVELDVVAGLEVFVTPNPVAQIAQIAVIQEQSGPVQIDLIDLQGRVVSTLLDADLEASQPFILQQDVRDLHTGTYLIRAVSGNEVTIQRLLVVH